MRFVCDVFRNLLAGGESAIFVCKAQLTTSSCLMTAFAGIATIYYACFIKIEKDVKYVGLRHG